MTTPPPPQLVFPCDFPIKIFGKNEATLLENVFIALQKFVPNLSCSDLIVRESKNNNYMAITLHFVAQNPKQIAEIYEELKKNDQVVMVL